MVKVFKQKKEERISSFPGTALLRLFIVIIILFYVTVILVRVVPSISPVTQ